MARDGSLREHEIPKSVHKLSRNPNRSFPWLARLCSQCQRSFLGARCSDEWFVKESTLILRIETVFKFFQAFKVKREWRKAGRKEGLIEPICMAHGGEPCRVSLCSWEVVPPLYCIILMFSCGTTVMDLVNFRMSSLATCQLEHTRTRRRKKIVGQEKKWDEGFISTWSSFFFLFILFSQIIVFSTAKQKEMMSIYFIVILDSHRNGKVGKEKKTAVINAVGKAASSQTKRRHSFLHQRFDCWIHPPVSPSFPSFSLSFISWLSLWQLIHNTSEFSARIFLIIELLIRAWKL